MSRLYRPESVSRLVSRCSRRPGQARTMPMATVESLVTSSLMGHDSHGVIRIPEYLGFVADGSIVVDAPLAVERTGPTTAVVDCRPRLWCRRRREGNSRRDRDRARAADGVRDHATLQSCRTAGGLGSARGRSRDDRAGDVQLAGPWPLMFCPGAGATDDWRQTRSPTRSRPAVIRWWRTFRRRSRPRERSGSTATRENPYRTAGSSTQTATPRTTPTRSTVRRAAGFFR